MNQYPSHGTKITQQPGQPMTADQYAALQALQNQRRVTSWPYYSTVKFHALASDDPIDGPVTYDVARGTEVIAFSYGIGEARANAGYSVADGVATEADTNLTRGAQTTSGQNVLIHGIALQWLPAAMTLNDGDPLPHRLRLLDHRFAAALNQAVGVRLMLNGEEQTFKLGRIHRIPGAGGFAGSAQNITGDATVPQEPPQLGFPSNGWQTRSNFFKVPEGLIWRNQGTNDSVLELRFRLTRAIRIFSGGSPEHNVGNVAGEGEPPPFVQSFPSELAAELEVQLIGSVVGPRSRAA